MVTTFKVPPCPLLEPFISCYLLREFNTHELELLRPWTSVHEVYLTFFLKDKPVHLFNEQTGYLVKGGSHMAFQGIATHFNGIMIFNGCYSIFNICFKPNGFHKIFRFPLNEVTNKIFNTEDVFSIPVKLLYEQLQNSITPIQMATYTDEFLLYFLKKQKSVELHDGISKISDLMLKNAGCVSIKWFANEANMSLRNFNRRFAENLGINPKLFCKIIRFNHALEEKIKNPAKDWTAIAHESGYFDQMHLIRDFKQFAGSSPKNFMNQTPPPVENITLVRR